MASFEIDPNKPLEQLLADVKAGAVEGAKSVSRTSTFAIAPFSALLVRLARDADKTARTVRNLTWALIGLTGILIIMTGALVWLTWVLAYSTPQQEAARANLQIQPNPKDCQASPQVPCGLMIEE